MQLHNPVWIMGVGGTFEGLVPNRGKVTYEAQGVDTTIQVEFMYTYMVTQLEK